MGSSDPTLKKTTCYVSHSALVVKCDERDYKYQDRPIWSDAEMTVCDLP